MKERCKPERVTEGQGGMSMGDGQVPQAGWTCLYGRKNQRNEIWACFHGDFGWPSKFVDLPGLGI